MIKIIYKLSVILIFTVLSACSSDSPSKFFSSKSGKVIDPSGKEFLARGVNFSLTKNSEQNQAGLDSISAAGANIVRLKVTENTSADELKNAFEFAHEKNLALMPVLTKADGRAFCDADKDLLLKAVEKTWFGAWEKTLLKAKNQERLLINIASGWGPSDVWRYRDDAAYADWVGTYTNLIKKFRAEGYKSPLVLDAPGCGQDFNGFLNGRSDKLTAADADKNIVFSVQAFSKNWSTVGRMSRGLAALNSTGAPFMVSDFGAYSAAGEDKIDHKGLIRLAQGRGALPAWGWVAWNWGPSENQLSMMVQAAGQQSPSLSAAAQDIISGEFGIQKTAKPATF